MKRFTSLVTATLVLAMGLSTAQAFQDYSWDANGTTGGFFDAGSFADGTWGIDGAQAVQQRWTTDPTGLAAPIAWNDAGSPLYAAHFAVVGAAAGNTPGNLLAEDAIVTIPATQTRATDHLWIDSGWVALSGSGLISITGPDGLKIGPGAKLTTSITPNNSGGYTGNINTGANPTLVASGGELQIDTSADFNTASTGKITLQGGMLTQRNFGSAGSFIRATQSLEVDGTGTINYPDASFRLSTAADCNCTIYTPTGTNTILGAGGTTGGGGAGTLIKIGAGEFRFNGTGQPLTTFAKLVVKDGLYRAGFTSPTQDERAFGAVPLAVLPDAITLDGGYIGHSLNAFTFNANRGITLTANGGGWAGGTSTLPGPLTGTGRFSMIGTGAAAGGQLTLTNAGNATTFTGSWNIENGTVVVAGDGFLGAAPVAPVANHIMMGGVGPQANATTGTLSFTASTTLNANRGISLTTGGTARINVATGGNTVTYNGVITGPGKFIKMGDGTVNVGGNNDYAGGTDVYGKLAVNNTTGSGTGTGAVAVKTLSATLGTNGTLAGTGTISGAVTVESGAHVAPGNSGAGILSVGSAALLAGSITDIELGGTTFPTQFDRLSAATTAALDGTLNVTLINGYTPANNDTIHIITAGSGVTGTFSAVNLPTLPGLTWNLAYNANSVSLTALVSGGVPGDFNGDGKVDASDYASLRKLNPDITSGAGLTAYNTWRTNFGTNAGSGGGLSGGAVPEPATMVFAGLAMFFGLVVRRR
jgi:PEP-CTERM motif